MSRADKNLFMSSITDEKKKLREYKYRIEINNDHFTEDNQYYSIITDRSDTEIILYTKSSSAVESYIDRVIQCINHIIGGIEKQYRRYCLITIRSDNVYFLTMINDWIKLWKSTNFANHAHQEKLIQLHDLLQQIHYKTVINTKVESISNNNDGPDEIIIHSVNCC